MDALSLHRFKLLGSRQHSMPLFGIRESPNVKSVITWPDGSLGELKGNKKASRRSLERRDIRSRPNFYKFFFDRADYYIFFLGGALIWVIAVRFTLKFLRFPFHRHVLEIWLIYLVPVLVLFGLLVIIDAATRNRVQKLD